MIVLNSNQIVYLMSYRSWNSSKFNSLTQNDLFALRTLSDHRVLRWAGLLLLCPHVKVRLLDIATIEERFGEYKVRAFDERSGWLQLVATMILPLDEVIILTLLALDRCDDALDLIEENWTNSCLWFQLVNDEPSFFFRFICLLLNVLEEIPTLHVFWVWSALLVLAQTFAIFVAIQAIILLFVWTLLLWSLNNILVMVYFAVKLHTFRSKISATTK